MAKAATEIVREILAHVAKCGGQYSRWYAGVATAAEQRLFNDHKVDRQRDAWIYREATSEAAARAAEKSLLEKGFDGGPGGGQSPTHVYAYMKAPHTDP